MSASPLSASPGLGLVRYRLARAALDLRTFTAGELVSLTQAPLNTVHGFLHDLGTGLTKEMIPSKTRGRPRNRYSLTDAGVEKLVGENFKTAQALRATGLTTVDGPEGVEDGRPAARLPDPLQDGAVRESLDVSQVYGRYLQGLSDLHDIEMQEIQILPRVTVEASPPLQGVLQLRIQRMKHQHARLTRILKKVQAEYGPTIDMASVIAEPGIALREVEARAKEGLEPQVRDSYLVAAVKKVEHHRVARYGSVRTLAELLGEADAAKLIQTTLDEEREAETLL